MTSRAEVMWRAVSALREAEALAQLTPDVAGPADEPPTNPQDEPGWIEDWAKRAGDTLEKARSWATSTKTALKERARRIAGRVKAGVRELYRVSGAARASQAIKQVSDTATTLQMWGAGLSLIPTAVLAYLAYRLFLKKG